jgi:putative ABC transport system permease protein
MPPALDWPQRAELWKPLAPPQQARESRGSFWLPVMGRLKPGVSVEQAQTEMSGISDRMAEAFPGNRGYGANVVSLRDQLVGSIERPLAILMASVAFVLLIACANLANLMLGRTAARRRELAVRMALGAGRRDVLGLVLSRGARLAGVGVALGVLGSLALTRAIQSQLFGVRATDLQTFVAVAALLAGVGLFATLAPAVRAMRLDPVRALRQE